MKNTQKLTEIKVIKDHDDCPVLDLLSRLGDKWSVLVILTLANADNHCLRFSELQRSINGISQRMLSSTLKNFVRDGIVNRQVYPEIPPRVEYQLTARGTDFLVPVKATFDWMIKEWPSIEKSRQEYNKKHKTEAVPITAKKISS